MAAPACPISPLPSEWMHPGEEIRYIQTSNIHIFYGPLNKATSAF